MKVQEFEQLDPILQDEVLFRQRILNIFGRIAGALEALVDMDKK